MRFFRCSFNTQPPEGGWIFFNVYIDISERFNTQPPEGGWGGSLASYAIMSMFQHTAA